MAAFLSQASNWLQRSNILATYTIEQKEAVNVGLWKVHQARHPSNGKSVSIFEFDKAALTSSSKRGTTRVEAVIEILKREASTLTKMRHPCLLEVVEPLEETRNSLIFATEMITCTLKDAIDGSSSSKRRVYGGSELELDEVESQKGMLQICKALQFLHDSARAVHTNITPQAIIINAKGDWKLSGLAFVHTTGSSASDSDSFDFDISLPPACQRNLDFSAPELVIHHDQPAPAADMWSLGCVAYGLLSKTGNAPFSCRSRIESYRKHIASLEQSRTTWNKFGSEGLDLLNSLILVSPTQRLTCTSLPASCSWFSSILVSTLRFLDRDHFPSKSTPEQISFLKGLRSVLPRFSAKVRQKRVLPALLEQGLGKGMRKELIPTLLPNILFIAQDLSQTDFRNEVWPHIKQLFNVAPTDSPENALAILEHLPTLQEKCDPALFKEEMGPLLLALLSSTHAPLLVKTLQTIPTLCNAGENDKTSLDFATVRDTIFPKVAEVFTRTTILGVKVAGLVCFGGLVAVLDKYTLQEKLSPLLSKVRTKEPSVLIACLNVFSLLASRLTDPVVLSTLILPQLWTMSAAPLLNEDHFNRFMRLIDDLSNIVKRERGQELRAATQSTKEHIPAVQNLTFEELVRGQNSATSSSSQSSKAGNDFLSGALTPDEPKWLNGATTPRRISTPSQETSPVLHSPASETFPSTSNRRPNLGAKPIPSSSFSYPMPSSMDVMQPLSAKANSSASHYHSVSSTSSTFSSNQNAPSFSQLASASQQTSNPGTFSSLAGGSNSFSTLASNSQPSIMPSWSHSQPQPQPQYVQPVVSSSSSSVLPAMNNPWTSSSTASSSILTPSSSSSYAVMQPSKPANNLLSNTWKDLDPLG